MLKITIPKIELFNEETNQFITIPSRQLQLEHSLVSMAKWEAKWEKPFLTKKSLTHEETLDYIRCMTLTQNVPNDTYKYIPNNIINEVMEYISRPMTATVINDQKNQSGRGEQVTAELIYYWMIALTIPSEYQKWHLNRLITLIKVCNIKNQPPKKSSKRSIMQRNASINAARRAKHNSKG